jgi:hypothetical protein
MAEVNTDSTLKTKVIQALTVVAFGVIGDMKFKVFGRKGELYFTSSKSYFDESSCFSRAENICIRYWEQQNQND